MARWRTAIAVCVGLLLVPLAVLFALSGSAPPPPPHLPPRILGRPAPPPPEPAAAPSAEVQRGARLLVGQVTDEDEAPIGGVELTITGWGRLRTFTDEAGRYRLRSVPLEPVELMARASGYHERRVRLSTGHAGGRETHDLTLVRGAAVAGVVLDPDGKLVAGSMVSCADAPSDAVLAAVSGPDGRFTLVAAAAGCRAVARHPLWGASAEVQLREGAGNRLQLRQRASIAGVVVDQRGRPVVRYRVAVESYRAPAGGASRAVPPRASQQVNDAGGRFELSGLKAGRYVLLATAEGHPPARSGGIALDAGEQRRGVRIAMGAGGIIEGVVRDASNGAPLAGARVALDAVTMSRQPSAAARSDDAGRYRLASVPEDAFSVRISAPGYLSRVVAAIAARAGVVTRRDFELQPVGQDGASTEYSGIGAVLASSTRGVLVGGVFEGGPSAQAGLKMGDRIVRIDGTDARDLSVAQAVQRLRGRSGTRVAVTVGRGSRQLELVIERAHFRR